jgi:hypothetical protein
MVNESCYDPAAVQYAGRNLADAITLTFTNTSKLAICSRRRSRRTGGAVGARVVQRGRALRSGSELGRVEARSEGT